MEQRTGNQITVSLGPTGNIQCVSEIPRRENQNVTCYVRPEKLFFEQPRPQTEPVNSLQGALRDIHFFGSHTRYRVQLPDGQTLTLSSQQRKIRSPQFSVGDTVRVLFAVADVFLPTKNV